MMIETERLILRNWQETDREPLAKMNADTEVMRYFPTPMNRNESDAMMDKMIAIYNEYGYTFFAVELRETGETIGLSGLIPSEKSGIPNTPFVEIGWRFAKEYWRQGYAFEANSACLNYAFNTLALEEVYSFTAVINEPSWRLMHKLGMINTQQDFNHPKLAPEHALARHCLYKIGRQTLSLLDEYRLLVHNTIM